MTRKEFLNRIDEIMCDMSDAERTFLSDMYTKMMNEFEYKLKEWVKNDGYWFITLHGGEPCINETCVDSIMRELKGE